MSEYNLSDYDSARAEWDFKNNPPSNEIGMGEDGWSNVFSGSSDASMNDSAFGGMSMGSMGGGMDMGMGGSMMSNQQQPKNINSIEGLLTVGLEESGKFSVSFLKELVEHFKGYRLKNWVFFGLQMCKAGFTVALVGIVLVILSLVIKDANTANASQIFFGGALSGLVGFIMWFSLYKKAIEQEENSPAKKEEVNIEPEEDPWGDSGQGFSEFEDNLEYEDDGYEEDPWGDIEDTIDEEIVGVTEEDLDINKALEEMPEITCTL